MQQDGVGNEIGEPAEPGELGHGRKAQRPSEIPPRGWWDIAMRLWTALSKDRVMLVAAGASFYLLLALFPALVAFVSLYGLFADTGTVAGHVAALSGLLPDDVLSILRESLDNLALRESGELTFGIVAGLAVAFWSANNGVKALFEALNVAYGESEKRSFIWLNLVAFGFTIGAMLAAAVLISAVGVVPALLGLLDLGPVAEALLGFARWPVLLAVAGCGISLLYRYGPSRRRAKWRWITLGSVFATVVWLAAAVGFSYYLSNFGNYDATYGSLGAVVGFMMWIWISVLILIVGAQLNAEMEHQTAMDSTIGPARPMGRRGATMADTLGRLARRR